MCAEAAGEGSYGTAGVLAPAGRGLAHLLDGHRSQGFTFMQLLPHSPGQVAPRKEALGSANDVFQGWLELLRGRAPALVCPVVSGREHTCQLYTGWLASLRVRRAGVSIPRPWLVSCSVPVSGLTSQSSFAEGGCLLAGQWVTETIWEWRECAARAGSHTAWK